MKEQQGTSHKAQQDRVNRIAGQVRGIQKMIDDQKYCLDILTQIKAARSALKSLEISILEGHANHCILQAVNSGSEKLAKEKVEELLELVKKSSKS